MKLEELYNKLYRGYYDSWEMLQKLLAVASAAKQLVGPENIGKTVDTSIKWQGAVSTIVHGVALSQLVDALEDLECECRPVATPASPSIPVSSGLTSGQLQGTHGIRRRLHVSRDCSQLPMPLHSS